MKNKLMLLIFLFICINLGMYNVFAQDYIAECVYNNTTIFIDKNYNISSDNYYCTVDSKQTIPVKYSCSYDIVYEDFLKDNKFSCENVSELYLITVFNDPDGFDQTVWFSKNENDHKSSTIQGPAKMVLNKEKSKVYSSNYDEQKNTNQNWDYTCHYGKYYLSFNKQTCETNADKIDTGEPGTIVTGESKESIMKKLSNNYYSCPASLCISTQQYDHKYVSWLFSYELRDGCIPATITTGDYKCGAINTFSQRYNSVFSSEGKSDNSSLNKIMQETKSFCSSAYSNLNYSDSNNCIIDCKNFINRINKDLNLNSGECGISQKLAIYISNIVKWAKYIVPVIVIVLGILDFIKAISADKDDEMKKAQGRFVKRLIAAALIFIIPFIIEFVLDKMGFGQYISGCGIDVGL